MRCLAPDSLFRPRWSGAWARIAGGSWMRERVMGSLPWVCVEKEDVRIPGSSCTWSHGCVFCLKWPGYRLHMICW